MHLSIAGKPDPADLPPTEDARDELLAELLARVARKDEAALADLYRQLNRSIYAFSLRRLGDPVAADEIVVETMYEVWRHGDRFAGQSRVTTWVLGIARHKILDRLRQRGQHPVETLGEEAEAVPDGSPDSYVHLAEHQQAAQIARCMDALPEEQRECLHLVFYQDLSLAEVAEIQACPANTVKTRLFHARRKMRGCLERQLDWLRHPTA
jgi:RNA polymerase sigma-70 factor (ECF subfamily)